MLAETALICLALNIYHEARGEPVSGQMAVAAVTMNRAGANDRVCRVVFAPNQFTWTRNTARVASGRHKIPAGLIPKNAEAWGRAIRIAHQALEGQVFDFSFGAKHYHADYVSPNWSRGQSESAVIGRHIFYRNIK